MQHNLTNTGAHEHAFHSTNPAAEKGTVWVMWITAFMMLIEIVAGWWYNSMALQADGWHMSSHTLAIGLSAFAYSQARKYAKDTRFAFGTWKIEVLSGFASALFLMGVAAMMIFGSIERLFSPEPIHYTEAIFVALLGLGVNLVCAFILGSAHDHHGHSHGHSHAHSHGHSHQHERQTELSYDAKQSKLHDHGAHATNDNDLHSKFDQTPVSATHEPRSNHSHPKTAESKPKKYDDLNLRSAYIHVVADAATSVLAIFALLSGMYFGWSWLDPMMGIVGAVLVAIWAKNLVVDTAKVLLDREMDDPIVDEVKKSLQNIDKTIITDLHIWRIGSKAYACSVTLQTQDSGLIPLKIKELLQTVGGIAHATVEINN